VIWKDEPVIVAGSGPSLTAEVARAVRMARWLDRWRVLAVNDAYKVLPFADAMYACDWPWWRKHDGAKDFKGQRYTSHSLDPSLADDKSAVAHEFPDIKMLPARNGAGFGRDVIHYGIGGSSGFQAVNLAINFGASRIVLVGFDYRHIGAKSHFFGDHEGLRQATDEHYRDLARAFGPAPVPIVNATPGSAIGCYPAMVLSEALQTVSNGHRMVPQAVAMGRGVTETSDGKVSNYQDQHFGA